MRALLQTTSLVLLSTAALGAGCASTPDSHAQVPDSTGAYVVDGALPAGISDDEDDLVGSGAATLVGAAVWDTLSVAEWMALAVTTPEQRRRAEESAASGAYLDDDRLVARLQPGALPGTAETAVEQPLGTAFESEVLHRLDGGQDARLDLTFSGETAGGGRRMPSLLKVSFFLSATPGERRAVVYVGDAEGEPSELAQAPLPPSRGPFAHRLDVQYQPGAVVVLYDGQPVVEAAARLGGGPMTAAITAMAPGETRSYLLRWVLDTGE